MAEQALPAPLQKPDQLQTGTTALHGFTIMDSTVGQSKKGRRRLFPVQPQIPAQAVQVLQIQPAKATQPATSTIMPQMPYSTVHYRKKKIEAEQVGKFKRAYHRKTIVTACGKCGEDKKGGGHHQYYGNIYCPTKMDMPYDEWKTGLKDKGYGKRKTNDRSEGEPSQKKR